MSTGTSPLLFRLALLGLIVVVAWAVWQSGRIRDLKQQVTSAGANADALQRELAVAEAARDQLAASTREPISRSAAVAETASYARPRAMRLGPMESMLLGDPEYQKAMLTQLRGNLDARYAGLFRRLNLSPEKLQQLKSFLVERQASTMDALVAARSSGDLSPGGEAMRSLVAETQSEIDRGIAELLGDELFAVYRDYNENGSNYALADQLERRLSYTTTPLTVEQADELVRILNQTRDEVDAAGEPRVAIDFVGGGPATPGARPGAMFLAGVSGTSALPEEAITQARSILTAEQMAALLEIQEELGAQQTMFETLRRNFVPVPADPRTDDNMVAPPSPRGG